MKAEYKIIADHLRSSCFLIADGVLPSNEGRGYVLRRIMRRAMRQLHKLGARETSMYKFVDALIEEMGAPYPELSRARAVIVETLKNEEEKFRETLEKGLKILEEEISSLKLGSNIMPLAGSVAFKLYDTYGFPLDLTQDILREKGLEVDIEGFNREMETQRERAKANWKGSGEESEDKNILELQNQFGETKFLGYHNLESSAKIIYASIDGKKTDEISEKNNGQNILIILDQTPFYATSGGQKGDDGILLKDKNKIEIFETKKVGKLFIHQAKSVIGSFKINDEIIAQVNPQTRQARARNHSATHLMHKALKLILGNTISQKGSNVDAGYFTFDFNFNRGMNADEISKVENLVNFYITQNSQARTEIMPLEKAREQGAEALFGEKYDNEVRVVTMGEIVDESGSGGSRHASAKADDANKPYSIELCGGTHVKSTGDIETFKIISESGIAAGIRRIKAITGFYDVKKYNNEQEDILKQEALKQEQKQKEKEIEKLKKQTLLANLSELKSENIGDIKLVSHFFEDIDAKDLREITTEIKAKKEFSESNIFVLFASKDEKVSVCVALNNNLVNKFDATKLIIPVVETIGGKGGGGKKDLAMGGGTNKNAINEAIEIVKKLIK